MQSSTSTPTRTVTFLDRDSHGLPRTPRSAPAVARDAAYRRLAVAILRLDVATLAHELESARHHRPEQRAAA